MAKLYFNYGAMNSSKTANALMTYFNYKEVGQRALLCKTDTDTRDGARVLCSRIGLEQNCILLYELMEMPKEEIKTYHCIIVDEVQFATKEQIDFLSDIVDFMDVPVVCYGLRTDFQNQLFPGVSGSSLLQTRSGRSRPCAGAAKRRHAMRALTGMGLCVTGSRSCLALTTVMLRFAGDILSLGCCVLNLP